MSDYKIGDPVVLVPLRGHVLARYAGRPMRIRKIADDGEYLVDDGDPTVDFAASEPRLALWTPAAGIRPDPRPSAARVIITPETLRRIESLGFVPGSGNPVSWLVERANVAQVALAECDGFADDVAKLKAQIATLTAELARVRALVPGVEAEWITIRPVSGPEWHDRNYQTDFTRAAMRVNRAGAAWEWRVWGPALDAVLSSGTAPSLAGAKAEAEAAGRSLGLPL